VIVVFDSGVWISALHFGGTPLVALDQVFINDQLAVCDQIVTEVCEVLVGKFEWEDGEVRTVLDEYLLEALYTQVGGDLRGVCRDPKDDMVLECAVNAEAQFLVTGDNDLLALELFRDIRIVTPRTFLTDATSQWKS
jgi:uncharacterized protein